MKPTLAILSVLFLLVTSVANAQLLYYDVDFSGPTAIKDVSTINYIDWNGREWIGTLNPGGPFHLKLAQVAVSEVFYYKTWGGGNWWTTYSGGTFHNYAEGTGYYHPTPNINTYDWEPRGQTVAIKNNGFLHPDGSVTDWINYKSWDNSDWTAALTNDGKFMQAPGVGGQLVKDVQQIEYVGWDNQHWTATISTHGFHISNPNTHQEGDIQYLYYQTTNNLYAAIKFTSTSVGDGFGAGIAFDFSTWKNTIIPPLQIPVLPHISNPPHRPGDGGGQPPPINRSSVATFIAAEDCEVGTKLTMVASWGVFQLRKGNKVTKVVPVGKRLIYGAHLLSSPEMPAMPGTEPAYKGTVGAGETVYVP
jgi:hypothetical protein